MKVLLRVMLAGCLLTFVHQGVAAQTVSSTTGAINGTVTDATKSVMPGVTVTLSGSAVMGTPTTVTDQAGVYRFARLAPGDYKLAFELSGFSAAVREGIHVSLGFTATVNVEMSTAGVTEDVIVTGASPIVDLQNTNVTTHFDAETLATLPGSRDFWSIVAQTPAVSMSRMDVGGSGALTQQPYTSYGLSSSGGVNRGMIEGMVVNEGGGGGGSDLYYTDYGSFAEIAVNAVGNTSEMPNPGVLSQFISKSGGNTFHGDVYFDYESDSLESHNIDAGQIARGVSGSSVVPAQDTNRLASLKDFDADLGGYLVKDKMWWYGAYRYTVADQRYPTLLDDIQHTWSPVGTVKLTYNVNDRQKIVGYYQHSNKKQPDYLGAILIGGGRQTTALMTKDSVWSSVYPVDVWKLEYNSVLSNTLFMEVLGGNYRSIWTRTGKSTAPRVEDLGNNIVSGGVWGMSYDRGRPQARGSVSYTKAAGSSSHNMKFGGEIMNETLQQPFSGTPNASNALSVLNNGAPTQVRVYLGSNTSRNGVWNYSGYANDIFQVSKRLTLNFGLRFDRFRAYLPAQTGPDGTAFSAVDSAVVWSNWGPRVGGNFDLTGDGKTVIKANFGQYALSPAADFTATINPNPSGWYRQYAWKDANGDGYWEAGEEGLLQSVSGGSTSVQFDPGLKNQFSRQVTTYLERELMANFGIRTGFVWNGLRNYYGQINVSRPLSAYGAPVTVTDPGPDGKAGTSDDRGTLAAYNLSSQYLGVPPVNTVTQLEQANSDYYTWELTATKRESGRLALQASFAHTWARERAVGTGTAYTPNALINTIDGRNHYTTWQAKANATLSLPADLRVTPIIRFQSGSAYGRTFVSSLNYGTATILSEPYNANRTPNIALLDIRTEKGVKIGRSRVSAFFDLYNIFNSNAEQAISTSSGGSWQRPTAITPPRVARMGLKLVF